MNRLSRVSLACALGAFVGALVALEVNSHFWWLGLIAGGMVGYFSYEFKKVVQAVPRAWQQATAWRPNWNRWKEFFLMVPALFTVFSNIALVVLAIIAMSVPTDLMELRTWWKLGITIISFTLAYSAIFIFLAPRASTMETKGFRASMYYLNPFRVFPWLLPKYTLVGLWWLVSHIPAGARVIGRFFSHLFRLIHSDLRLLCGLDAAIGAGIGYASGSVLIGALAGGVIGLANYELVSKRWLGLVPVNNG